MGDQEETMPQMPSSLWASTIFANRFNLLHLGRFCSYSRQGQARMIDRCVAAVLGSLYEFLNILLLYIYGESLALLLGVDVPPFMRWELRPQSPLSVCLHYESLVSFTVANVTRRTRIEAYERLWGLNTRPSLYGHEPWFMACSATTCVGAEQFLLPTHQIFPIDFLLFQKVKSFTDKLTPSCLSKRR